MALNKVRLQKLIDHMTRMPNKAFDLSMWMDSPKKVIGISLVEEFTPQTATELLEAQEKSKGKHICGTSGCIAGYAGVLARAEKFRIVRKDPEYKMTPYSYNAMRWLGLNRDDARKLFVPTPFELGERPDGRVYYRTLEDVTRKQAIKTLENLRDTGVVDWSVAFKRKRS